MWACACSLRRPNSSGPQEESTPLHVASGKGYIEIVNRLIAARADVNTKDKVSSHPHSQQPLHSTQPPHMSSLSTRGRRVMTSILCLARPPYVLIIAVPCPPDLEQAGRSVLSCATANGHTEVVEQLVTAGATE